MTTSVSQKLNILCTKLEIITLFMITLLAWLYVKVDILLTYVKHMNDRIISLQWNVWSQTTSLSTAHIMQVSVLDKR